MDRAAGTSVKQTLGILMPNAARMLSALVNVTTASGRWRRKYRQQADALGRATQLFEEGGAAESSEYRRRNPVAAQQHVQLEPVARHNEDRASGIAQLRHHGTEEANLLRRRDVEDDLHPVEASECGDRDIRKRATGSTSRALEARQASCRPCAAQRIGNSLNPTRSRNRPLSRPRL
jgi:hypothetical protein